MTTLLYTHKACLEHDPGAFHPESPSRLRAVLDALDGPDFARLERREAPEAGIDDIARVHPRRFVERLLAAVPRSGHAAIDADTIMSPASGQAALRAAGAVIGAVDAVIAGEADNAFCAVRPPGHHAARERAMGFCIFNQVAVAARYVQARTPWKKVLIVDFDVHHGNGTQDIFYRDDSVFYLSVHRAPFYPGTGAASERGSGTTLNLPFPIGTPRSEILAAFESAGAVADRHGLVLVIRGSKHDGSGTRDATGAGA